MTQEELKETLNYNPKTGIFTWKVSRTGSIKIGQSTGYVNSNGYKVINIKCKLYYAHRLAFLYMEGFIPSCVDHIDRDKTNNRWSNLRAATKKDNSGNTKLFITNTSTYRGVSPIKNNKKNPWSAQIKLNDKKKHLGSFPTAEDAAIAYNEAAITYFGEFARLNVINKK